MFGAYRLCLAWCVIIAHISGVSHLGHTGMYAVFGFYVLSGYLITRVLNDSYRFAFVPFWTNRFLRLYPPYFFVLAIGLVLVWGTDHAGDFLENVWRSRPELSDWIGLLTIVPLGIARETWTFRPVPSIWSVGVELINYALLFAVVARGRRFALAAAILSAGWHITSLWRGEAWPARYFPFYAALLPFAIGALIFFHTKPLTLRLPGRVAALACLPALANAIVMGLLGFPQPPIVFNVFFYLNLVFQGLAVTALCLVQAPSSRRIDTLLGDLSYPVFLCHWLAAYVVALLFFPGQWRGVPLMIATLFAATAAAYVVCKCQDAVVEPLRARIRARSKAADDLQPVAAELPAVAS